MKNICIDLTNIVPGKGGAGGGIATYGKELILGIDRLLGEDEELTQRCSVTVLLNTNTYKNLNLKNLACYYFDVNNQNLLTRMFWLQVELPNFLRKKKMDLLHRVLSEMPIRKVCKYVVTVHDFMFDFYLSRPSYIKYLSSKDRLKFRLLNILLANSIKGSDLVITNSNSTSNDVRTKFKDHHSKIESTLLGYSPSSFPVSSKSSHRTPNQLIRFGVVAAFHPHKGHLHVIQIAKKLIETGHGNTFHFYLRGSPVYQEYYDEIKETIIENGLESYFTFEEYDPNITLADIYNSYTATVLLSDYEGFGLPVIESQAFLRPVICSRIPVFEEILGDTAIFLDRDPSDQQLENLMLNLRDKQLMDLLVQKGQVNSSKYTWSNTCKNTMKAYFNLLN